MQVKMSEIVDVFRPDMEGSFYKNLCSGGIVNDCLAEIPSRELTCPTLGKGKSSSKVIFDGIC